MSAHHLIKQVSALVVALVITISGNAKASGSKPAQLGTVQLGGSLTSGGTLSYLLNMTVTDPGTLTSKATIKGKNYKATFPDATATLPVGVSQVDSATSGAIVTTPSTFTGQAKLRIKVYFNGKKVGQAAILLTISAPPATPPAPQTTRYDVGFNTNVALDANIVSTNGLTAPFTYAWSITDTDVRTNAQLTGANTAAPTLKTLPITAFTNVTVFPDHVAQGVDLDKQYDLDTNPNLVGMNTEQVSLSTYHVRLIVTDASSVSKTGTVMALSTSTSPAQPTIPVGERQYFTAMPLSGTNASTYTWSFASNPDGTPAKPTGSKAAIESPTTRTPALRPDKEGEYVLQLSVKSGAVTSNSFVTVKGAKWVGVATCASCHGTNPQVGLSDYYTPWTQTKHATMAVRGIDGLLSPFYNESCLACHTVGNDKDENAYGFDNAGFDDVQAKVGWKFPTVLQVGNYAEMPTNLQNLANIQCESCHGPGSQHPGADSKSLDVAVCATCHQDGQHHFRPSQWSLGPHGADDGYLNVSYAEGINPSCSKCHSPAGFVDWRKGNTPIRAVAGRLTCQACHDPHNSAEFPAEAHQVRVYDTVTLDDSVNTASPPVLTGQGTSALCMQCHNARRSPPPTYASATTLPHESTAADVLNGIRASTNVQTVVAGVTNTLATVTLENSAHAGVAKCVNCHMYDAGKNTVGNHTFSVTDRLTDEDNLPACNQCHAGVDPVSDFDHISVVRSGFPGAGDYDGNGVTEGVQTEVDGLLTNLINKMLSTGLTIGSGGSHWTSYSTNAVTRAVQRNAAWNEFLIERELSHGVHNTAFTVRVLQWSYTVLSTNTGGNAYEVDFPNADLR